MATYSQIQEWVASRHEWIPETCHIAHVLESHGLTKRRAWNRKGDGHVKPCPLEKRAAIEEALRYYRMIK